MSGSVMIRSSRITPLRRAAPPAAAAFLPTPRGAIWFTTDLVFADGAMLRPFHPNGEVSRSRTCSPARPYDGRAEKSSDVDVVGPGAATDIAGRPAKDAGNAVLLVLAPGDGL